MNAKHLERKNQLETRLAELKARVTGIETDLDSPSSRDSEDRATEREDDEVKEHLGLAGVGEIRAIEGALERLKHDDFGTCDSCGNDISEERLNILPYTVKCRVCAQAA